MELIRNPRLRLAVVLAVVITLVPAPAQGASWGSSYGDPPWFCPNHSGLPWSYSKLVTNDPLVGSNPEQDTFFGFHPDPGYDDWYGAFYGDFRGRPGDASGWVYLTRDAFPTHSHWNFADFGWAVHGHAKQYIAYYNWTFGGECGMGVYGSAGPPPYMADQFGTPVLDIYVDSTPPEQPRPRVIGADTTSVVFTWDPVVDRGDGEGADYFAVGLDRYESWVTVDGGPPGQRAVGAAPRTVTVPLPAGHTACLYVQAVDRLENRSPAGVACAQPAGQPPPPPPPVVGRLAVNPAPLGLAGLPSWFWITPQPAAVTTELTYAGNRYRVVASPQWASWSFGDGASMIGDFGRAFPERSTISHVYEGWAEALQVNASVHFALTWSVWTGGGWAGPYAMPGQDSPGQPFDYRVEQAQPILAT